jgi:hypothetical protein
LGVVKNLAIPKPKNMRPPAIIPYVQRVPEVSKVRFWVKAHTFATARTVNRRYRGGPSG